MLDEMGKFLEAAAQDGTDIYLFQQIAEASARSRGRLLVIGVLHQAFDEYAQGLARETRDEWAKIQGRFLDLVVNVTGDEQLDLLSRAIEKSGENKKTMAGVTTVARMIATGRGKSRDPKAVLRECWPLHPIVACLLGPLSRRRFGQNQRSLFGFLNSVEPFGFQEYLDRESGCELYGPARLWDYLRANLEPAILASSDGHRWSMAVEVVDRCVALGGEEDHQSLLKTIALIDLFRERSGLLATPELVRSVLSQESRRILKATLQDLESWSLVLFRKHLGAYSVYAGSDFDIETAIDQALESLPRVDPRDLRSLAGLQPVLAKRHYHETGALRWLDVDLVSISEVAKAANLPPPGGGAMGRLLLAIPAGGEEEHGARTVCQNVAERADGVVVVGLSGRAWQVMELAREFLALCKVQDERPELAGDAVARREVLTRIADLRARLELDLQRLFDSATWLRKGRKPAALSLSDLNAMASQIADERFPQAPLLPNELLNRLSPSSNAIAAQRALLKRMVGAEGQERLGIEGFPAEGGLFESIVAKAGLYRTAPAIGWHFASPDQEDDPCLILPAWLAAADFIRSSKDRLVALSSVYSLWRGEPFGVREGLLPILGVAFILCHRQQLAFYREGVFQARFTDLEVDYLTSDPASIQVRWMNLGDKPRQLLAGLASVVQSLDTGTTIKNVEPIDVARGLVEVYDQLRPWAQRTSRLSANAMKVRSLLKRASDPNGLLFDDMPGLLASDGAATPVTETVLRRVQEGLEELVSAYDNMLGRIQAMMLGELQVPNDSPQALSELKERAVNIQQLTGDFYLNAFVTRLSQFNGAGADMEGIASLAVSKPPRDWVDADLDNATLEIAQLAQRFIRTEAFARVKGRTDKRQAMAVVVGLDGRPAPLSAEFDIGDNEFDSVRALIGHLEIALATDGHPTRNVILAALAEVSARYLRDEDSTSLTRDP